MLVLLDVLLASGSIAVSACLFVVLVWRRCCFKEPSRNNTEVDVDMTSTRTDQALQDGIAKLHQGTLHHQIGQLDCIRRSGNYYACRLGDSGRPVFTWADHPLLVADAVEYGWSRFGFTGYMSSSMARSSMLGGCATGDCGREAETEITWEVCQGSADFMQKIRLNSGLRKLHASKASFSAASVIRTALPLPGPSLENSSFPQEAYFEITILYRQGEDLYQSLANSRECEKTNLIQENAYSDLSVHVNSSPRISKNEELMLAGKEDDTREAVMLSLGLTTEGSLPLKLPGSYPGSIGFNSNGSIYLDGTLVFESDKADLAKTDRLIGCGFDPRQKRVFFTVDSELVHEIHCKSDAFAAPLYPTIAANGDITVLVNFGQSAFCYAEANSRRTPDPCFIGPLVRSPALSYDDSKELFSMGRIDSQWLNSMRATKDKQLGRASNQDVDYEEESEADLFEIVLDVSSRRSPNIISQ